MTTYRILPYTGADPRSISEVVNNAMSGKINNTGNITLTASSATATSLTDARLTPASVVLFMATTANASGFKDDMYVSARTVGSATISHSTNIQSDRTFAYAIFG